MQSASTYHPATLLQPRFAETLSGRATLAFAASLFVALAAHASVPLWFTPVPLTLGNLAVILVGLFLGPGTAFAALALYLLEGAIGLPVFNPGGSLGLAHLVGPSAGFLFAYPFAAALTGMLVRRFKASLSRFSAALLAAIAGTAVVLFSGVTWLALIPHSSVGLALRLGLYPFIFGEIIKVAAAAGIFSAISRRQRQA